VETIVAGAERAAAAGLATSGGDAAEALPCPYAARRRTRIRWALAGVLPVALATGLLILYGDDPLRATSIAFQNVRWEYLPALAILSVLHYVFAAIALRGAAGHRLPLFRTTLAQFTAAAANRVTPSGLGAVAVNTRYLVSHGMPLGRAAVAVASLQVAGAPADLILLGLLLLITQDSRMAETVAAHAVRLADRLPPAPALAATAALLPIIALLARRCARSAAVGKALGGVTDLCRRPGDLAITLAASAATTCVLGVAFALSVLAVPGTATPDDILPLLVAYLVGAAAGAALPAPGGLGSTEAALVGALAAVGISAGTAVQAVLLFRVVTYWAPVPIGLLTWRTLRRAVSPAPALPGTSGTPN